MEMVARRARAREDFCPQRKRRLFLARPRASVRDPLFRSVSRRAHGLGRGAHFGASGPVSVQPAIPDLVRLDGSSKKEPANAMKAVFVEQPGGVENMKYADLATPQPGPGQALVKIAASGVNYIDVYFRKGVYAAPV